MNSVHPKHDQQPGLVNKATQFHNAVLKAHTEYPLREYRPEAHTEYPLSFENGPL
jgi:hypothetical protein